MQIIIETSNLITAILPPLTNIHVRHMNEVSIINHLSFLPKKKSTTVTQTKAL